MLAHHFERELACHIHLEYRKRPLAVCSRIVRMARAETTEAQHLHRTAYNAGRAAHALDVVHRFALAGKAHNVDAHMAIRGADSATNALFLVGKDPILAELSIDIHQRRKRAAVKM